MKFVLHRMKPFSALALCYLLAVVVLKSAEVLAVGVAEVLPRVLLYNLLVACWRVLALGVTYLLFSRLLPRAAMPLAAGCFALCWLAELGLTLYAQHNGYLLGSELLARPLRETVLAVRGAVGLVLPIALLLGILAGGCWLGYLLRAFDHAWVLWMWPGVAVLLLMSLLFPMSHLLDGEKDMFIHDKLHYLVVDGCRFLRSEEPEVEGDRRSVPYEEVVLADLVADHPEWNPLDLHYPLERVDRGPDVLSPLFAESEEAPNVVLIVVESMGREFLDCGLMPFVDSLAATGLCWDNCLSTTMRSFGALPALTGSLGGPKSFQFGNMPDHNSLISILAKAGYRTQAFYGGDFTFDRIFDYLQAEHIDYLSPFYQEYMDSGVEANGSWWGYHDEVMLRRTMEVLNASCVSEGTPRLDIVTTLTMHEDLNLADRARQNEYERRAQQRARAAGMPLLQKRGASALYTDDCLRSFMADFACRPDFKRTIFVITGDHASGLMQGDKLSFHHVPLIVWSPLLRSSERFSYLVTHNDVAPSLCRLLANRYGVAMPETVHWLGNGLDDGPKTMLVVGYNRVMEEMVWNGFHYQAANDWQREQVCAIGEDLTLRPLQDEKLLQRCRMEIQRLRYLYEYTYYNNRLTRHPIYPHETFSLFREYRPGGEVRCVTPATKPSEKGNELFYLMPPTVLKHCDEADRVRVKLESDVLVVDSLWQDEYMELTFLFDNGERQVSADKIANCIAAERIHAGERYHIEVTKEFPLSHRNENLCAVYVATARYDDVWVPGSSLVFSNNIISLYYGQ